MRPETRVLALVVAGILAMVALARWSGGWTGRADREREVADSAVAAGARLVARARHGAVAAGRLYVSTEDPDAQAQAAMDRALRRARDEVRAAERQRLAALAAAADSTQPLPALRLELTRSAATIERLQHHVLALGDSLLEERRTGAIRLAASRAEVDSLRVLVAAQDAQEANRERQVRAADRQRPRWWQRLLTVSCESGGAAGGAGVGALTGGPAGAAIGAVVGVGVGALACR